MSQTETRPRAKRHAHTFTALWWHFGPYGVQGVHVHGCFDEDCERIVVGAGRDCDPDTVHKRATLGRHTRVAESLAGLSDTRRRET